MAEERSRVQTGTPSTALLISRALNQMRRASHNGVPSCASEAITRAASPLK